MKKKIDIIKILAKFSNQINTLQNVVLQNETTAQSKEHKLEKRIKQLEEIVEKLQNIHFYKEKAIFEEMKNVKDYSRENLEKSLRAVDRVKETIKNTLAIVADVNKNDKYDKNWALVCLKVNGKTVVKHINLSGDGYEIYKVLESYAFAEARIDSFDNAEGILYQLNNS
jgi:hypothetical protein